MTIQFRAGGIFLPQLRLWLDSSEPQQSPDRVFISHAHSDHTGIHGEIITTAVTAQLMRNRLTGEWRETILPFRTPLDLTTGSEPGKITLLPAGHIFGSAMAFIEAAGTSLLYTGDFKLRLGLSAEPCEPRPAEVLIMETTYGRPAYRFPPSTEVLAGVVRFCREALDNDETPILFGYSLGKSQELLCSLGDAKLPLALHPQIFKMTKVYEQFGHCFPSYEKLENGSAAGKVLLCPPHANSANLRQQLGRVRSAVLTGWAVDPGCRYRYQTDAAFPLSDHADFPELIDLVRQVSPKKIYTLHGFAAEFAQTLRDLGYDAEALSEPEQLALPLSDAAGATKTFAAPARRAVEVEPGIYRDETPGSLPEAKSFQAFAQICAKIGGTSKKLEKVELLAGYLRGLTDHDLGLAVTWFAGKPFAPVENKVLQLGWALIRDAACTVADIDQAEFGRVYLKHSDLGETIWELLQSHAQIVPTATIESVQLLFQQLHAARGPIAKLPLLAATLRRCSPDEGKFLVKIVSGDLRIGLKEGLVEEAVAKAFGVPLEEVKNANLLLSNIGETARLARLGALASASLVPFRPVKYMLASPEPSAPDIWKRVEGWSGGAREIAGQENLTRVAGPAAWVEDKYDGIRSQLHKVKDRVVLYSRDLREITPTFQELADSIRSLPEDFVLDGEIVGMRGEQVLPFADLQKRLGRRESDLFLREEIPVRFIGFDLLWLGGRNLLGEPLAARRDLLEKLALPSQWFRCSQIQTATSPETIEEAFSAARVRGNEGLMVKDPASAYSPGRRGLAWLKLKKVHATLDCVVVGAEYGHGRRKAVLSDYTFAVRDEHTGQLKTIGKAYSGLTDVEIAELTRHFLGRAKGQHGRYFEVEPDVVLEIAFDIIQPSNRHTSGLALRFPRIVRIRTDKSVTEIDTLGTAQKLVEDGATVGR